MTYPSELGLYPLQTYTDKPDLVEALATLVEAMEQHDILWALTEAERNQRYGACVDGTVVAISNTDRVLISMKAPKALVPSGWITIKEYAPWLAIPDSWFDTTAFTRVSGDYRVSDGYVELTNVGATYTGAAISVPGDGNIANLPVLVVPAALRPRRTVTALGFANGGLAGFQHYQSTGGLNVAAVAPGVTLASGFNAQFGDLRYPLA